METKKYGVKRLCLQCSKEFTARISYIQRGHGKYCSVKCMRVCKRKERKQTGTNSFGHTFRGWY